MNLSKLRQMTNKGDMSIHALRYLIACRGECEYLDYKEDLVFTNDYSRACFVRDALAMRNSGGGYIVVGVQDKTWQPVGIDTFLTDTKQLRDIIRGATDVELEVDVVSHQLFISGQTRLFVVILIRSTSKFHKLRSPSIVKKSFHPTKRWGIRNGDIYIRRGDETARVSSHDDFMELLDNLFEKNETSAVESELQTPSPFEVETGLYRLLPLEYQQFVERPDIVDKVKEAIESDPRIWIINLYGPGGVGKSAVANRITRYYYEKKMFDCILQLSAKNNKLTSTGISKLSPSLYSLENLLDIILLIFEFSEFLNSSLSDRKGLVIELLSDYKTLLILDNMETVTDGRVMEFVRSLPPTTKAKILLTSRTRTSGWELPIRVDELSIQEVREFVLIKAKDLRLYPLDNIDQLISPIHKASGGLPLAIQWMLGKYVVTKDWEVVTQHVRSPDSPLLEFSFRNSWNVLSEDAQKALAVLSIFDEPPTANLWATALTALNFTIERLERAVEGPSGLVETTFVSEKVDGKTGLKTYQALPITLEFAQNELAKMGNLEVSARTIHQRHIQQMELVAVETERYQSLFEQFKVERDTEKQAIILARKAEAAQVSLNYDEAEDYYERALEIDPRSVFVLVNFGRLKHELGQVGKAINLFEEATRRCTKNNGFYVYYNLQKIYDAIRDRRKVEDCLEKALRYNPNHKIARHQLGMVISRQGRYDEAIKIFDSLIDDELNLIDGPTYTLIATYKTKIISLQKAKRLSEAISVLEKAKKEIKKYPRLVDKISELEDIVDN